MITVAFTVAFTAAYCGVYCGVLWRLLRRTCDVLRRSCENFRKIHVAYCSVYVAYCGEHVAVHVAVRVAYCGGTCGVLRLSCSIYLNLANLWAYRKAKVKAICHVCGFIGNKSDLKRHYQRQHPTYEYAPLANDNTTTKLLEPDFVPKKGGFVTGNRYASSSYKENS